jgi:hypothetical protein
MSVVGAVAVVGVVAVVGGRLHLLQRLARELRYQRGAEEPARRVRGRASGARGAACTRG